MITKDGYKLHLAQTLYAYDIEEVEKLMVAADKLRMRASVEPIRIEFKAFSDAPHYKLDFYTFEKVEEQED